MKKQFGKKILAAVLTVSMLLSIEPLSNSASAVQEPTNQEPVNLSIASVTASSSKAGHTPELTNDGIYYDDTNNWVPESKPTPTAPQWLVIDFGKTVEVGVLEAAVAKGDGPKSYEIQVSNDGSNYDTVFSRKVETSRALFAQWETTSARYLKLVIKDSFSDTCAINELTAFEDILPHRIGVLAGFPDMANFGDKGMDALHAQGQQLFNLCVSIADPASPGINILPDLIDDSKYPNGISNEDVMEYVSNPDNYSWEYADWIFEKFIDAGFDIWLGFQGFSERAFPEFYTDIVDEDGRVIKHRDFFNDIQNQAVIEIAKQTMMHFENNPHIRCYSILGPGWFGGIEFYSGSSPERLAVYSEGAQNKFREWLEEKYGTIAALNAEWGTTYDKFEDVVVPKPIRDNTNAVDDRPEWADLMIWKIEYMDNFINQYMTTMRSVSDKPIHVEIDGGYQSAPMETGESMGKIIRDLSKYGNVVVANSNLDASYGPAQFMATAKFYGMEDGTTMDDTGQLEEKKHLDNCFNFLSRGAGTLAHCSLGADYTEYNNGTWDPDGDYSGTDIYHWTKQNADKISRLDPEGTDSDVVVFNPWYANLFRQGYNKNNHNYVFDADHGIQWYGAAFANWTHYLNSPEIYDDFPIMDGALEGKKVLIEPNMDVALTTNAAEEEIKSWINGGGALVGFGKDCFNYSFNEETGRLEGGDTVDHWMMGLSGGTQVTDMVGNTVKVSENAPDWLKSLEKGQAAACILQDASQKKAFSAVEDGVAPILEDEAGNVIMAEKKVGNGSVLFCTVALANTEMFQDSFMSKLLSDYVDSRGIARTVTYDPEKFHVVDAGFDQNTGKRIIEVSRNEGTSESDVLVIGHDSSLDGVEAVIDLNWKTDGFIYHPFEAGKAFVYSDNVSGEVSGSADITKQDGKTIITMDLGHEYNLDSIILNAEDKVESLQFKDGTYASGWSVSGEAFGSAPSQDEDGNFVVESDKSKGSIGKVTSKLFTIEDNVLSFYANGYAGSKPSSETGTEEPGNDEPIVVEDFSTGDWSGLAEVDETVFGTAPLTGGAGGPSGNGWDGYYATSQANGEDPKGTLKTKPFTIQRKQLSFLDAGYSGPAYNPDNWEGGTDGGRNVFRLRDAKTDEILIEEEPINVFGSDTQFSDFREHVFDVSAYEGREVYFEMEDGISGGFAWFAFTNLRQTGPAFDSSGSQESGNSTVIADFESGDWSEIDNVDTSVFGDVPAASGVPNGTGYYVHSGAVSEDMKGSLKTKTFIIDRPTLTFLGAGWNGTAYAAGDWPWDFGNRYYLKDAETGEILIEQVPENRLGDSDKFMTYTWDVTDYAGREVYFEMVDAVGAEEMATYGGGFGWIAVDNIMLTGDRFGQEVVANGYNGYYLKDASGNILRAAYPKNSEEMSLVTWDVSNLKGQQVYFEAIDGIEAAENGWMGFGEMFTYNYKDAPEDDYWSFESGTYDGWERTGDAFPAQANSSKLGRPMGDDNGTFWADTNVNGEDKTGTLTSKEFVIEKPFISFLACGWNGQGPQDGGHNPPKNYYELIDTEGNQLRMTTPPGQDSNPLNTFIRQYWDVSDLVGQTVRFRMADGDDGSGYAWLALDSIRQENNFSFENGYAFWNFEGEAFGTDASSEGIALGARGAKWADSRQGGSQLTGSLTSELFVMENDTISFLAAGFGAGGKNYYRLVNEAGEEITRAVPPEDENFTMLSMTAPGYKGQKVRFEAVDGSDLETQGWLALDDINFRFLFPDTIGISTSADKTNWTEAASLKDMAGKTYAKVELPAESSARYIQFELSRDDVDMSFLNLVEIDQNIDVIGVDLPVVNGIVDLGSAKDFNAVIAKFASSATRNFTVSVSLDGTSWIPVQQSFEADGDSVNIMITKINARYLKFEGDVDDLETVSVYMVTEPKIGGTEESENPGPSSEPDSSSSTDPDSGTSSYDPGDISSEPGNSSEPEGSSSQIIEESGSSQDNGPTTGDSLPYTVIGLTAVLGMIGVACLVVLKKQRS